MDFCDTVWNNSEWERTTSLDFQTKLKDLFFPVDSSTTHHTTFDGLTVEAICMIILIVIFILLALMGSLITAYEYFHEKKDLRKVPTKEISDDLEQLRNKKDSSTITYQKQISSILKCFCIFKNGKNILEVDPSKEKFSCLHGMRLIACVWAIMWHLGFFYFLTLRDMDKLKPWLESWVVYIFTNSFFIIDIFFISSGFITAYSFSKDYLKNDGKISIPFFYLKRFVRLMPVYMMVLGFYTALLSYTWKHTEGLGFTTNQVCQENWWWNFLFINNFQTISKQCMQWCWYLAIDMQFYIVSPIFIIAILRRPTFGYCLTSLCVLLSCFAGFITTKHCNLLDGFTRIILNMEDLAPIFYRTAVYFEKIYIMPHTRINPYLVGILLGMYIQKRRNSEEVTKQRNWVILSCGWILSTILIITPFFALYNRKESAIEIAVYNGVNHLFVAIGFSWVILTCVTGQGGFLNRILSWRIFFPFSRLSYCAYLIHMVILMRFYQTAPTLQEFSFLDLMRHGLVILFWTFLFAFFVSAMIEIPMRNLLYIFNNKKSLKKDKNCSLRMLKFGVEKENTKKELSTNCVSL